MATEIELFIGTYEEFLLSYKIKQSDDETFSMERFITYRCHNSPIRCMDTHGRYLATGGSDDRIVIIDLKLNKEVQLINQHKASVNTISFTSDGSHLLSGSEDGQLIAMKVGSWLPENMWNKPHSGKAVFKVCIHESGKCAFTLGKDGTLRTWDMIKGRQINTVNVRDLSEARVVLDNIQLCPNSEVFAMSGCKTVTIISVICGKLYNELQLTSQITSMCWIDNENLLIGMENGSIEWTNITEAVHENIPNVHTKRIKGMHHLNGFVATICSSGDITLWSTLTSEKKLTQICTTNVSCRPICVRMINTTENRYKEEVKIETIESSKPVVETLEKQERLKTVAKVIIEIDGNDEDPSLDGISNNNKKKKIKPTSGDKHIKNATCDVQTQKSKKQKLASGKKRVQKKSSTKKRIVISTNSEDDFDLRERPKKKIKTNSSKSLKEETKVSFASEKEKVTPKSNKKMQNRLLNNKQNNHDSLAMGKPKKNKIKSQITTSNSGKVVQKKQSLHAASQNL